MKKIFTLLAGLLIASSSFAIPAMAIWRTVKQADGTLLKVMTVGDEHFNYAMTEDGIPLVPYHGNYYYAHIVDQLLVASAVLAHNKELRHGRSEFLTAVS